MTTATLPAWRTPMTPNIRRLATDALDNGFQLEDSAGGIHICRRHKGTGKILLGVRVRLTETGGFDTAWRTDIPSSIATDIRTLRAVRSVFGLTS